MYNKYQYHHKILVYLNDKRNVYIEHVEKNKKLKKTEPNGKTRIISFDTPDSFSYKDVSDGLGINLNRAKETLIELTNLDFIDSKDFKYSANNNTIKDIDSNYFKKKRRYYLRNTIARDIKDFFIITVAIATIFSSLYIACKEDKKYKKDIQELQSELKTIKEEQTKIQNSQKLILNDSLTIENPLQ